MSTCRSCGQPLGEGRYCPHCGTPVDPSWRTDTAERPAVRPDGADRPAPRTPPSAVAPPPPPRYPLFADEVTGWTDTGSLVTRDQGGEATEPPTAVAPAPVDEPPALDEWFDRAPEPAYDQPAYDQPAHDQGYDTERRSPWRWLLITVLVLAVVGAAWWFVVRETGGSARDGDPGAAAASDGGGELVDLADGARARAPESAPPNEDVNGERTTYDAANMVDGDPTTTWRVAGDASGTTLRFVLPQAAEVHQVGLVNGYAKTATDAQGQTLDWYAGNRRVLEVVWVLPGGQQVRQSLEDGDRELQVTDVDPVETDKVVLRITKVSAPGEGPAARDFTAISEVALLGPPVS